MHDPLTARRDLWPHLAAGDAGRNRLAYCDQVGAGSRTCTPSPLPDQRTTRLTMQLNTEILSDGCVRVCLGNRCGTVSSWHLVEPKLNQLRKHMAMNPDCNPIEQQARQDELDRLYAEDNRHNPEHPMHSLYTGLVAEAK